MVAHDCDLSTWEPEIGIPGYPGLLIRPYLNRNHLGKSPWEQGSGGPSLKRPIAFFEQGRVCTLAAMWSIANQGHSFSLKFSMDSPVT